MVVAVDGGVATLTLNRPDRKNAMTTGMVRLLHDALVELASADDDVRVVVLTGAGASFCPGADVFNPLQSDVTLEPWHFRVPVLLREMPQVTVAAVNGACAGAGLGWALACDLRYAARSARFATAFLRVGVAGDMGVPWTLTRVVGPAKARELLLLGDKVGADEAAGFGMVSAVFDDGGFRQGVADVVARLAGFSPPALRALKEHLVAAERMSLPDFVDLETARHLRFMESAAVRGGMASFADELRGARPPA